MGRMAQSRGGGGERPGPPDAPPTIARGVSGPKVGTPCTSPVPQGLSHFKTTDSARRSPGNLRYGPLRYPLPVYVVGAAFGFWPALTVEQALQVGSGPGRIASPRCLMSSQALTHTSSDCGIVFSLSVISYRVSAPVGGIGNTNIQRPFFRQHRE